MKTDVDLYKKVKNFLISQKEKKEAKLNSERKELVTLLTRPWKECEVKAYNDEFTLMSKGYLKGTFTEYDIKKWIFEYQGKILTDEQKKLVSEKLFGKENKKVYINNK